NWYGAESPDFVPGGLGGRPLDAIIDRIAASGFTGVRMPWSNELLQRNPVPADPTVAANPELRGRPALEVFDTVVRRLAARNLLVVLDNHLSKAAWCCHTDDGNALWYTGQYPEQDWLRDWRLM